MMIFFRNALVGPSFGMFGCSAAYAASSCASIDAFSSYDQTPLRETSFGVGGVGTFRIAGETDENKQPNFNLAFIDCESETDDRGAGA
ncbi:hypothetical protein QCM77_43220 [Bradyrhizobium sp. SSUT18]|uniref:hypothetical protein n=1 Tax=Bradyrhizobium sp. SSUT18 TaxID=3040602 RepID=UPI00244A4568|nr:hypothetical protein [Bradyrhizobium sp. SSUT18]MDH2406611.1 hypothetical protein [Bradyrhizobium sp. SSUT18]